MRHVVKVLLSIVLVIAAKESAAFMVGQEVFLSACFPSLETCSEPDPITVVDGEDPDVDARRFGIGTIDIDDFVVRFGLIGGGAGRGDVENGFFNGWVVSGIEYAELPTGIDLFDVSGDFSPIPDDIRLTEDGFTINYGRVDLGGPGAASFRFLSEGAPAVVPLPPAAILFASSLATLGLFSRRRRSRSEPSGAIVRS